MGERNRTQAVEIVTVPFAELVIDDAVNARVKGTDPKVVAEYAEARKAGAEFPPGRAFRGPDGIVLSRGFHRAKGYQQAGDAGFPVEIHHGDRTAARIDALGDNADHGLKRTNEDKRNAVELALELCPEWTQEEIARECHVSQKFVGNLLAERAAEKALTKNTLTSEFRTVLNSDVRETSVNALPPDKGVGRPDTKVDDAARVAKALGKNAGRDNEAVAKATKTKPAFVAKIRKALEKKGLIEPLPKAVEKVEPNLEPSAIKEAESPAPEPTKPVKIILPPTVDDWGIPIQPHATEAFAAVPKFKELVNAIRNVSKLFNELALLPGGRFLTQPDVSSYRRGQKQESGEYADKFVHPGLEKAFQDVKRCTPTHTVCPFQFAEAKHPDDCPCCRNLNWTPALGDSIPKLLIDRAKTAFADKEAV